MMPCAKCGLEFGYGTETIAIMLIQGGHSFHDPSETLFFHIGCAPKSLLKLLGLKPPKEKVRR